jgi:hypothetical protein
MSNPKRNGKHYFTFATEDYDAESNRELSIRVGDRIKVIYFNNNYEWCKGELEKKIGYFPKRVITIDWNMEDNGDEKEKYLEETEKKRYTFITQFINDEKEYLDFLQLIKSVSIWK